MSHGAVAAVEQQDLVAVTQVERPQDGIDAGRGVVDEHEVVAARAEELCDLAGRGAQARHRERTAADGSRGQLTQEKA
jgi:hypothetical protein